MRRGVQAAITAMIAITVVAPAAARPDRDPHYLEGRAPRCADLPGFVADFNAALEAHPTFTEFVFTGDLGTVQTLPSADVDALLEEGQATLDDLAALDVPPAYADGFTGLNLLFSVNRDFVNFLARDTSAIPEIFAFDRAIAYIYNGEREVVQKCPGEVEDLGGYIFIDPATLEEDVRG
ncbi:MAG: hypothetical protein M3440_12435 [Chloroflexota bacterium]|nr:hypothetical protein [Chloroflexota bacterium]